MNPDTPVSLRPVSPEELWRRLAFRGCRLVRQTSRHRLVVVGGRYAVLPRYGERLPASLVSRIIIDLGVDPWAAPTR